MPMEVSRYRLTVDQYMRMGETGILPRDVRCELIEGEILMMASMGPAHRALVARATRIFVAGLADRAVVFVQSTFRIGQYSAPEPDLVVLVPREDFYENREASPEHVLLIIEVADSSLGFDRDVKLRLYRAAGIAEYWIINVPDRVIEVYHGEGGPIRVGRGETLHPQLMPGLAIKAEELLG